MKTAWTIAFSFLLWPISVMAQDPPSSGQAPPAQESAGVKETAPVSDSTEAANPAPAVIPVTVQASPPRYLRPINRPPIASGYALGLNVSAGYSVTSLSIPSGGRVALQGTNVDISAISSEHFGAKLDVGYAQASNVYGTGRRIDMISYQVGPQFFPWSSNLVTTYTQVLIGGARVAGPLTSGNGGMLSIGHVHYPTWTAGGGAEYRLSPAFGFRVGIDYMRTHFYNAAGAVRGQNDFRVVNSLVYYFGAPIIRRHHER